MAHPLAKMIRLVERGGPGLCCDADGVALGPVPLVERISGAGGCRYRMRAPEEIVSALAMAYGPLAVDALTRCMSTFDAARRALNVGDIARAGLVLLHLRLPELARGAFAKLETYPGLWKAYNPDQRRDERGRWTSEARSPNSRALDNGRASRPPHPARQMQHARSPAQRTSELLTPVSQFQSRAVAPFTDEQGNSVLDFHGKPMARPSDVDPRFFVEAGRVAALDPNGIQPYANLLLFDRGAAWDVQRVGPNRTYVDAFKDFANVAIGLYAAAAGIPLATILAITNWKAASSNFGPDRDPDPMYTNTPKRIVYDIKKGYELVQSDKIGSSRSG